MANRNYTQKVRTASGYDTLFPKTTAEQVITDANHRFISDSDKNKLADLSASMLGVCTVICRSAGDDPIKVLDVPGDYKFSNGAPLIAFFEFENTANNWVVSVNGVIYTPQRLGYFANQAYTVTRNFPHVFSDVSNGYVTLNNPANLGFGKVVNESKETMFTSPALTGTPTAPTAAAGTNNTQLATTAYTIKEILTRISPISVVPGTHTTFAGFLQAYRAANGNPGYANFVLGSDAAIFTDLPITPSWTYQRLIVTYIDAAEGLIYCRQQRTNRLWIGYLAGSTIAAWVELVSLTSPLTGLSTTTSTAVVASDTVIGGIGKLQAQINALATADSTTATDLAAIKQSLAEIKALIGN